ncbi:MAG TPA: hypothetical protein VI258_14295, partial [Rhodanobacteraceae bacterium]
MRALAAATLVVATALAESARAAETEYPRAIAAASALHFSQSLAAALKTPTAVALIRAVGGS